MKLVFKRVMDVLLGGVVLLAAAPFMAIIALLLKLDSPGPVLITETRLGQDQKPFALYKFRSQQVRIIRSRKGTLYRLQPELTRVGRRLRRYRLDLLPQFLNVLKGEMSLVGPRPLPLKSEIAQYNGWKQERFDIKPGMTGLWQVSAQREFSAEEMMRLDMYYIWNWSFSNDVKILLRTIPLIFFIRKTSHLKTGFRKEIRFFSCTMTLVFLNKFLKRLIDPRDFFHHDPVAFSAFSVCRIPGLVE